MFAAIVSTIPMTLIYGTMIIHTGEHKVITNIVLRKPVVVRHWCQAHWKVHLPAKC
jgi:hypothetical protein